MSAIRRLKLKQIDCLNNQKLVDTGFVDTLVFDKTGTLTETDMKIHGIQIPSGNKFIEALLITDLSTFDAQTFK